MIKPVPSSLVMVEWVDHRVSPRTAALLVGRTARRDLANAPHYSLMLSLRPRNPIQNGVIDWTDAGNQATETKHAQWRRQLPYPPLPAASFGFLAPPVFSRLTAGRHRIRYFRIALTASIFQIPMFW